MLFFGIIGLSSCVIPYKKFIILPEEGFELKNEVLRSNGYFYCEKERDAFCQRKLQGTGVITIDTSRYTEKHIEVLVLYNNGQAYHSGGLLLSGIDRTGSNYYDHCYLLEEKNNYNAAREDFEELVERGMFDHKRKGLYERGVYNIWDNLIDIQIYHTGYNHLILYEYRGEIINDSTINITSYRIYPNRIENVDELYKFVQYMSKPDSTSYILNNREKFGAKK